jgi:hypothetical protein
MSFKINNIPLDEAHELTIPELLEAGKHFLWIDSVEKDIYLVSEDKIIEIGKDKNHPDGILEELYITFKNISFIKKSYPLSGITVIKTK